MKDGDTMIAKRRYTIVKYVLLDLLQAEQAITIDRVMLLSNERLTELDRMDRNQTKRIIVEIIEKENVHV